MMFNTTVYFISKLDVFPFISPSDIVSIGLIVILENISMCDTTLCHLIQMKTIISILKVSTYINTNIIARPIGLAVILVIVSVSIFKTAVIQYISWWL